MRAYPSAAVCLVLAATSVAHGADLWVDGAAPGGGSGSQGQPFQSVSDALKKAIGGDTITLRKGTYREVVNLRLSGTPQHPTILRAAPGERVILSGFAPITNWAAQSNGIYTAAIEDRIVDLYVGLAAQPVARWPDVDQPARHVKNPDPQANTFQDDQVIASDPRIKEIAASPQDAMACFWANMDTGYAAISIAAIDATTITLAPAKSFANIKPPLAHYELANHPALIQRPGQWAFEKIGETQNKVYFKPNSPADLEHTQYRVPQSVLIVPRGTHDVRIEGLEVCGSANYGIQIDHAENITVARCIIHDNTAVALWSRHSKKIIFQDNLSVRNRTGMSMASTQSGIIEGNEIAFNVSAGINVAGNVTGQPDGEPDSTDITIRNNYVHHQVLRSYSTSFERYPGVHALKLQDNVFLYDMGGIDPETIKDASIKNCIMASGDTLIFDANGTQLHASPSGAKFQSAPFAQSVSESNAANRANHLLLRIGDKVADMSKYKEHDAIELNGDGILRHITAVGADSIDFAPALPVRPFNSTLVWDWKGATSTTVDLRFEGDKGTGLDVSAYLRGDLYGNGKRSVPELPEDLQSSLARSGNITIPLYGP